MAGRKQADEYVGERNAAGECEGGGEYRFASGSVYKGECKANNKDGRGTYTWKEGDVYDGEYKADNKEGRGIYRHAKADGKDGDVYNGEYKAGKMEGQGKYLYASGNIEVGFYKAGKGVGESVKWTADGRSAWQMQDGKEVKTISNEEAERNVERLKLPMPVRREGKWAAGQPTPAGWFG